MLPLAGRCTRTRGGCAIWLLERPRVGRAAPPCGFFRKGRHRLRLPGYGASTVRARVVGRTRARAVGGWVSAWVPPVGAHNFDLMYALRPPPGTSRATRSSRASRRTRSTAWRPRACTSTAAPWPCCRLLVAACARVCGRTSGLLEPASEPGRCAAPGSTSVVRWAHPDSVLLRHTPSLSARRYLWHQPELATLQPYTFRGAKINRL